MSRRGWLGLAVLSLAAFAGLAWLVRAPGYMDADYYFAVARQLAGGRGFSEPFLWNYLDDPSGLPHPSNLYWGPLTSVVAAAPMALAGAGFRVAQIPFVLLAALLPLLAAGLSLRLGARPGQAWLAGALAAFPGYFAPFLVTTDAFGLYALLGSLVLYTSARTSDRPRLPGWLGAGILAGLCHLTRADGALFLLVALAGVWLSGRRRLASAAALVGGYAVTMLPWWLRNTVVVGAPFAPGAGRVLWLTGYDELFSYPAALLSAGRWWQSGLAEILQVRFEALGANLQTLLGVNGSVFLLPLMALGLWRLRDRTMVRLTALYLLLVYGLMTVVFPFVGSRGGVFHSSAGAMPVLWACVPFGLEAAVAWGSRRRGWDPGRAGQLFSVSAAAMAGVLTLGLAWMRLQPASQGGGWETSRQAYLMVGQELDRLAPPGDRVAVNNPPGFHLATGREAVVIPSGSVETLQAVVARYDVAWVVADVNLPAGLRALMNQPDPAGWLERVRVFDLPGGEVILYRVGQGSAEGGS